MGLSKLDLTGANNGFPIQVTGTATPGLTVHQATSGTATTTWDEVWIYANNGGTVTSTLTLEFYSPSMGYSPLIPIDLAPNFGPVLVVPGFVLQNSIQIRAYASVANIIYLNGYVNAIT